MDAGLLRYFPNPIFDTVNYYRMRLSVDGIGEAAIEFEHRLNCMIENLVLSDLQSMTREVCAL